MPFPQCRWYLSLTVSLQPIDDAISVLLLVLPVALVLCLIPSTVVANFYAKSITKPIRSMSQATTRVSFNPFTYSDRGTGFWYPGLKKIFSTFSGIN